MNIASPMGRGSGAYVIHKILAGEIPGYKVYDYNPKWAYFPPALPLLFRPRVKPDIIHTGEDFAFLYEQGKTPLVITFHRFVLDRETQQYSSLAQRMYFRTALRYCTLKSIQKAAAVTSVSNFTARMIREELNYTGDIRVIYNGIDAKMFRPVRPQSGKQIKVLFSGNLTRRKGVHWLPRIADQLSKNIEILYTCGLRTKNTLPNKSNLINIGQVPFSDMPAVYQHADILLFPTVREGFGLAAAEAMACGLPIVTTNCSSLPELVVNGRGGYLCELGNCAEFARRINELADSPSLRKEMGQFNRARVEEKFSLQKMTQGYRDLFSETLESSTRPAE